MEDVTFFVPVDYYIDDDDRSYSMEDKVSIQSEMIQNRDPGYHKIKIDNRKTPVKIYDTTCAVGATIRNAISGIRMSGHKVGTKDEDLYFKVVDTSHPHTENGKHVPYFLYFESPEQWEKHFSTVCSESIKEQWREKYNRAIFRRMNQMA
jgi:hypothetical protein